MTGLTPSHFKQLKDKKRSPIEEIGIPQKDQQESIKNDNIV